MRSLITSFIQASSIGLLKEELNNYDFPIKNRSGPEVIPSSAPTRLHCGSNTCTDRKLKFVYVFLYELKLLYISLLLSAEPISLRPVLWKVDHRQFSILAHCLCSSPKGFPFRRDLQGSKGEGLLYFFDSREKEG